MKQHLVKIGSDDRTQAHIVNLVIGSLYNNPLRSCIVETISNAIDAAKETNQYPIKITIPTSENRLYKVQDFGPGMSPELIENVYTQLGVSTKRDKEEAIGTYGIGAMTIQNISNNSIIWTVFGGKEYQYQYTKFEKDGVSQTPLALVSCQETSKPTGTTVICPIKDEINLSDCQWHVMDRLMAENPSNFEIIFDHEDSYDVNIIADKLKELLWDIDANKRVLSPELEIVNLLGENSDGKGSKIDRTDISNKFLISCGGVPYVMGADILSEVKNSVKKKIEADSKDVEPWTDEFNLLTAKVCMYHNTLGGTTTSGFTGRLQNVHSGSGKDTETGRRTYSVNVLKANMSGIKLDTSRENIQLDNITVETISDLVYKLINILARECFEDIDQQDDLIDKIDLFKVRCVAPLAIGGNWHIEQSLKSARPFILYKGIKYVICESKNAFIYRGHSDSDELVEAFKDTNADDIRIKDSEFHLGDYLSLHHGEDRKKIFLDRVPCDKQINCPSVKSPTLLSIVASESNSPTSKFECKKSTANLEEILRFCKANKTKKKHIVLSSVSATPKTFSKRLNARFNFPEEVLNRDVIILLMDEDDSPALIHDYLVQTYPVLKELDILCFDNRSLKQKKKFKKTYKSRSVAKNPAKIVKNALKYGRGLSYSSINDFTGVVQSAHEFDPKVENVEIVTNNCLVAKSVTTGWNSSSIEYNRLSAMIRIAIYYGEDPPTGVFRFSKYTYENAVAAFDELGFVNLQTCLDRVVPDIEKDFKEIEGVWGRQLKVSHRDEIVLLSDDDDAEIIETVLDSYMSEIGVNEMDDLFWNTESIVSAISKHNLDGYDSNKDNNSLMVFQFFLLCLHPILKDHVNFKNALLKTITEQPSITTFQEDILDKMVQWREIVTLQEGWSVINPLSKIPSYKDLCDLRMKTRTIRLWDFVAQEWDRMVEELPMGNMMGLLMQPVSTDYMVSESLEALVELMDMMYEKSKQQSNN